MKLSDITPGTLYARRNGYSPAPFIAVAVRKHIVRTRWASNDNGKVADGGTAVLALIWGALPRNTERATPEEAAAWPVPTNVTTEHPPVGWTWTEVRPAAILGTWQQHLIDDAAEKEAAERRRKAQAAAAATLASSQAALLQRLDATDLPHSGDSWRSDGIRVLVDGKVSMSHAQLAQLLDMAGIA